MPYFTAHAALFEGSDTDAGAYHEILQLEGEWNQMIWYWMLYQLVDHTERYGGSDEIAREHPLKDLTMAYIKEVFETPFPLLRMLDSYGIDYLLEQVIDLVMNEMRQQPTESLLQKSVEKDVFMPSFNSSYKDLVCPKFALYRNRVEGALEWFIGKKHRGLVHRMMARWVPQIGDLFGRTIHALVCATSEGIYIYSRKTQMPGALVNADVGQRVQLRRIDCDDVIAVACGAGHFAVLRMSGLYISGDNAQGQLGLGDTDSTRRPDLYRVPLEGVLAVKCGCTFTVAQTTHGLYVWGKIHSTSINIITLPQKIVDIRGIIRSFSVGKTHIVVVTSEAVYGIGGNEYGQLGLGHLEMKNGVHEIKNLESEIASVECGTYSTMLLSVNGTLYACGSNAACELGLRGYTEELGAKPGETNDAFGERMRKRREESARTTFVQVSEHGVIEKVVCGHYHAILTRRDGVLLGTGAAILGMQGKYNANERQDKTHDYDKKNAPFLFELDMSVWSDRLDIICSPYFTMIVKPGGLFIMGPNSNDNRVVPSTTTLLDTPLRVQLQIGYENLNPTNPESMRLSCSTCGIGASFMTRSLKNRYHFCGDSCYTVFTKSRIVV